MKLNVVHCGFLHHSGEGREGICRLGLLRPFFRSPVMKSLVAALVALCLTPPALAEDLLKPTSPPSPLDETTVNKSLDSDVTHEAAGTIRAIDAKQGSVTIAHDPVA